MSVTGNVRPPEGNLPGSLIAGYFKDEDDAKKAIDSLREKGVLGDQIGVAMRSDEIPKHEKWISEVREELGKLESTPAAEETSPEAFWSGGIEERAAAHFETQLQDEGGVVVGVRCETARADEIAKILEDNDGDVAREAAEVPMRGTAPVSRTEPVREGGRIQLMGEMLKTHKDRINRGEVRLRKETVTEHQNVSVPVTREEVVIERRPGTGQPAEGRIGEEKEIRIPVSEERARVDKENVVLGEVSAEKRKVRENEQVGGDVRREEVRVEKEGDIKEAVEDRTKGRKAA